MALVSVLLVTLVMLGLAGAFFAAHRSDLALMTSGTYREESKNACLSIADFIQYKLQNDRKYGMAAFSRSGDFPPAEAFPDASNPVLLCSYIGVRSGASPGARIRNYIRGSLPQSQTDFEVEILNNLDGKEELRVNSVVRTPPRTCRAWITTKRGNVTQHIDFILKRSAFTNASITSGRDINVQITNSENGAWLLGARQPSGNSVRASGQINGPEVWSPTGRAVQFLAPPGLENRLEPPFGVMQADTLKMQVDGLPKQLNAGDQVLQEAEDNIDGVLSPGAGKVQVPELNRDDLQGPAQKLTLPDSKLVFRTQTGPSGETIHVLEGDSGVLATYDPMREKPNDRYFTWNGTAVEGKVWVDLESRVMAVAPNVELQTGDRAFQLRSVTSSGQPDSHRQPLLYLGSNDQGAAIDASSIDIDGSVAGLGALKSQSDLKIAAKSYLSTTPDFGIALHAERDIQLTKPGKNASDGLAVDWDAFAEGYDAGDSNSDLNNWATRTQEQRESIAANFKNRDLATAENPEAFDKIWADLTADFPADEKALALRDEWLKPGIEAEFGPDPDWVMPPEPPEGWPDGVPPEAPQIEISPAVPAGPGIDVDKYVRLREYLRTVKAGQPDTTWLESTDPAVNAQRRTDVTKIVSNQLSTFQLKAGQTSREVNGQVVLEWKTFQTYFSGENPYLDTYKPDMVFRGLIYAGRDFNFDTERKGVYIEGALVAKGNVNISNATGANFVYNSELLENLFATDEEDSSVPLERSYWAFY